MCKFRLFIFIPSILAAFSLQPANSAEGCSKFLLKLTEADEPTRRLLLKEYPVSMSQLAGGHDIIAKIAPAPADPMIELKSQIDKIQAANLIETLGLTPVMNQGASNEGFKVEYISTDSPESDDLAARIIPEKPIEKIMTDALELPPKKSIEFCSRYDPNDNEVRFYRFLSEDSIYEGFQKVYGLRFAIKFEEAENQLIATLVVRVKNELEVPFVTYKISSKTLDTLTKTSEPFSPADIEWQTLSEGDRKLREMFHPPLGFWLTLKTSTVIILKDAATQWIKMNPKKKAA